MIRTSMAYAARRSFMRDNPLAARRRQARVRSSQSNVSAGKSS
jgi:hypothetical protein